MKLLAGLIFSIISFSAFSRQPQADTTIKGIVISFNYSNTIFPDYWQEAPISAKAENIATIEMQRCINIVTTALSKYPLKVLHNELKVVYFLKSMQFYDLEYGGTNSDDALYITNDGVDSGYTDLYIEQTFHHEYSSILYRNHPAFFDESRWRSANFPGIGYTDPENGVGAIRNDESSLEFDTVLCRKGFLTQYSLSGLENDINTFAENLFSPDEGFWKIVEQYPRISMKVKLLISFYNRIDARFTANYFKRFDK
jgi:hypothetical protein